MGNLTPPSANSVQVRYWNTTETVGDKTTPVSHCHIIGERLFCCGLELAFDFNWLQITYTEEPRFPLCQGCDFVVTSLNRGVQVGIRKP